MSTDLPYIQELNDIERYTQEFDNLTYLTVKYEESICDEDKFPVCDLKYIARLTYPEILASDEDYLEELMWRINTLLMRMYIKNNNYDRLLSWLNNKISKAITLSGSDSHSQYFQREDKIQYLACYYPVVNFLVEQRDLYQQQKIQLNNLDSIIENIRKMISYRLHQPKS